MPAGKRQSIMMMRRGSMARKSLMGAQIGKGKPYKPALLHTYAISWLWWCDLSIAFTCQASPKNVLNSMRATQHSIACKSAHCSPYALSILLEFDVCH